MRENRMFRWGFWLGSTAFMILAGTFFHFVFELTGESVFAAPFFPVNESIWEHLKLILLPGVLTVLLVFAAAGWKKPPAGFISAQTVGIICGMALIVVFYYTYSGILGRDIFWMDILSFLLGCGVSQAVAVRLFDRERWNRPVWKIGAAMALLLLLGTFAFFSFAPPRIPLFADPENGSFGYVIR